MYASLVKHVLDPLDLFRSGDGVVLRYARDFERSQWLSPDHIEEIRWQRARALVEHAYQSCPFYRRRFAAVGLVPSDLKSLGDLKAIPILEKRDVQSFRDDMVATDWPRHDLIRNQTGGSTGEPISFFLSQERLRSRAAATRRHDAWAGRKPGDKVALLWGALPDAPPRSWKRWLRNTLIGRSLYLDTANITADKFAAFHVALKRFRPGIIQGYAKSVALFAKYLSSNGLTAYHPRAIITSAETLTAGDRELVERVFGCPVFNRYGCREFSVVASECERHDGMHVMAEGLYVEVLRGSAAGRQDSDVGSVVVTDLLNSAMPMIRYRIGDMAQICEGLCACGRGLPRLGNIEGRITDFLVGDDGRLVSGVFLATYVIAQRPALGQVQLLQDTPHRVVYRVCPPGGAQVSHHDDLEFLRAETKRFLGPQMQIDLELVDELALATGPSGKFLYCRSSVPCDFLDQNPAL